MHAPLNVARLLRSVLMVSAAIAAVLLIAVPVATQVPRARGETVLVNGHEAAAGEVLVKYRTSVRDDERQQIHQQTDADEDHDIGGAGVRRMHSRSFDTETLVNVMRADPRVLYAEPNYIVHAVETTPGETLFTNLWGLRNLGQTIGCGTSCYGNATGFLYADIHATSAWDVSTGSRANVVGVIDTGIDYTHPDLSANVWSAPSAFSVTIAGKTINCAAGTHGFKSIGNSKTMTCDPLDDNSHGTHVSGTIGAVGNNGAGVVGVNWIASIMGLKFLDAAGSGYTSDAINAIDFAIKTKTILGASANIRVLSNSWGGGGFSQALLDQINAANANDMLFVVAAGNNNSDNDATAYYPANYAAPNIVAVAATTNQDTRAAFSNYGSEKVHLGAPGQDILSTVRGGGYAYYSGTSMATPHVSGAAALLLSASGCSTLNTAALKTTLLANVDPTFSGWVSTGGRLNVDKAIRACSTITPPTPDFAVTATPASQSVVQGAGANYTVTVTPSGGFSGTVGLAATVSPQVIGGPSVSLSSLTSGSSTMAVTTSSTTPTGTYTLTVTGTSGALAHTTTVTLVVTAPVTANFTLSASPLSRSVKRGRSTTYTVSISRSGGFTSGVTLSVTGLGSGATASFKPNPATATSSTLTITTRSTATLGTFPLTITGAGGGLTKTASVSLTITR
jgi:serine protease